MENIHDSVRQNKFNILTLKSEGHEFPAQRGAVASSLISRGETFEGMSNRPLLTQPVEICSQCNRDGNDKYRMRKTGGLANCPHLWICTNVITCQWSQHWEISGIRPGLVRTEAPRKSFASPNPILNREEGYCLTDVTKKFVCDTSF